MSRFPHKPLFAALLLTLLPGPAVLLAQETEPANNTDAEAEDPSVETDISEDNYRRFMELDDRRLERPAFPVSAVQPTASLQKMGELPESSQKHLRNQLRGIILSRGAWTPAERDEPYPFLPSAEARGNAQLLRQEAEAWNELVNEYHDREAAILAGAAGQPSDGDGAAPTGQPPEGQPPGSPSAQQANAGTVTGGNPGDGGQQGEEGDSGQEGREGAQGENGSEGGPDSKSGAESSTSTPPPERPEVPDWVSEDETERPPTPPGDEGSEQNASAYLKARGLADSVPVEFQGAPGRPTPDSEERASRWGEEAQTLLDDPEPVGNPSRPRTPLPPASDRSGTQAPANSLTREELRRVRGVTGDDAPVEDAFSDFGVGATTSPARTEDSEERPEDGDERGDVPDRDEDGRP